MEKKCNLYSTSMVARFQHLTVERTTGSIFSNMLSSKGEVPSFRKEIVFYKRPLTCHRELFRDIPN